MKRKLLGFIGIIIFLCAGAALVGISALIGTRCYTWRELLPWALLALIIGVRGSVLCIRFGD